MNKKLYAIVSQEYGDSYIVYTSTDLKNLQEELEDMKKHDPLAPIGIEEIRKRQWNTDIFDFDTIIEKLFEQTELDEDVFYNVSSQFNNKYNRIKDEELIVKLSEVLDWYLKENKIKTFQCDIVGSSKE